MSSKYSRMAIDCLMNFPSGRRKIGAVPLGFPGAVKLLLLGQTVTSVTLMSGDLRRFFSAR